MGRSWFDNIDATVVSDPAGSFADFTLAFDEEADAIRRFHEANVAAEIHTGSHLLCYKNGERVARVKVREHSPDPGDKRSALTVAAMLLPALEADEAMWVADTWMSAATIHSHDRQPIRHEHAEAVIALAISMKAVRGRIFPYERYEGLVRWDTTRWPKEAREVSTADSHVVEAVRSLLVVRPVSTAAREALVWRLSRGGYELKLYEPDEPEDLTPT